MFFVVFKFCLLEWLGEDNDSKEVKSFEHRIPLQHVTHLSIDGDVVLNHVQWGGKYYPVPYESGIAEHGLIPGKTLVIYGTPEKKAKK
ncbi:hypothetical protein ANCCAN_23139 [Ancylostoma caninum]|uniref:Galectin domain-containing protein n=1 Tax=Ancylostoma caninum TaxID=29170 RepID=A0A368FFT2_ANCCA|nr:hypothetical protein ANCCAN_23139 [Ancylostoma caninum]